MSLNYERQRVLIWGKTYPQLSAGHRETVCTGACLEDGTPIRIYPIPFRYLDDHRQYSLYDWIEVPIANNSKDARPESFKAKSRQIVKVGEAGRERGWSARRKIIFANNDWHYNCLDHLKARQEEDRSSLGIIPIAEVSSVNVDNLDDSAQRKHNEKLRRLKSQDDLFQGQQKDLEFLPKRVRVEWYCGDDEPAEECSGHSSRIYDWGLNQLSRKRGISAARQKIEELSNLEKYDLHFYVGNMAAHPTTFIVIGLWYPKRQEVQVDRQQGDLFSSHP